MVTERLINMCIKSFAEAMHIGDHLWHFGQFHGYQDLGLSIEKENDLYFSLQLRTWQQQTAVKVQIMGTSCSLTVTFALINAYSM